MADGGTAGVERFVWEELAPRLLHPAKRAVIQTLLQQRRPLSLNELADAAEVTAEYAAYICRSMVTAGVLEVSAELSAGGDGDEPSYFFPKSPQALA